MNRMKGTILFVCMLPVVHKGFLFLSFSSSRKLLISTKYDQRRITRNV